MTRLRRMIDNSRYVGMNLQQKYIWNRAVEEAIVILLWNYETKDKNEIIDMIKSLKFRTGRKHEPVPNGLEEIKE